MLLASGEPESSLIIQDPSLLFYLIFFYYMKCFIKFKKTFFITFYKNLYYIYFSTTFYCIILYIL